MEEIASVDYTQLLEDVLSKLSGVENALHLVITFLFVYMIVIVCKFAYKQFNIFFK